MTPARTNGFVHCTRCWDRVDVRIEVMPPPCKGCGGTHPWWMIPDGDRALVAAWARAHEGPLQIDLPRSQMPWFTIVILSAPPPTEETP